MGVAKLTGWGFVVISLPVLVFLGFTLFRLIAGLKRITGLSTEDMMHPR